MTAENEGPSEDALFDGAVEAPEPSPAPRPDPAPVERSIEQPEAIAAKPDAAKPDIDDDAEFDANGQPIMVPKSRIRGIDKEKRAVEAERDAARNELQAARRERDRIDFERQEFQRRLAAAQPRPEPSKPTLPDPLIDPDGYREGMERRFEERLANERREASLQFARRSNPEEFDRAYATAHQLRDPGLWAHMQQSSDPGATLMGWYRDLKFRAEAGNDPAAYKERLRQEALKDPEFRKAAMEAWRGEASGVQPNGRPNIQLAPSLNGVSRSNAALRASQQDLPDDDLFDATTQA